MAFLSQLTGHLRPLEIAGQLKVWSDTEIDPGAKWENEIVKRLDTADIILILVSAAYYNSSYIHEVELKYALERHRKGEAHVLPVIVHDCSWNLDPLISALQVLPKDGRAVSDSQFWATPHRAWLDVVGGVNRTVETIRNKVAQKIKTDQKVIDDLEAARLEKLAIQRAAEAQKKHDDDWIFAFSSQSIDGLGGLQHFLDKYPNSPKTREARAEIKRLKKLDQISNAETVVSSGWKKWAVAAAIGLVLIVGIWKMRGSGGENVDSKAGEKMEAQVWAGVQNDIPSLRWFIQNYPNGRYSDEAKKKLDRMESDFSKALKNAKANISAGENEDARAFLKQAEQLDPKNQEVQKLLKNLK